MWTAALLDELLQLTLSQLLIQVLDHLPPVLEEAADILPTHLSFPLQAVI